MGRNKNLLGKKVDRALAVHAHKFLTFECGSVLSIMNPVQMLGRSVVIDNLEGLTITGCEEANEVVKVSFSDQTVMMILLSHQRPADASEAMIFETPEGSQVVWQAALLSAAA